jgi:hypothetical protein
MAWRHLTASLSCATLVSLGAACAHAKSGNGGPKFSAEVGAGIEYDSNVSVEEIDRASSESDQALVLEAGLQMQQQITANTDLRLTYDYSQNDYQEFSQVDRQTHIVGADVSLDMGKLNSGLSLFYIDSRLDGDAFLQLYRASPSISGFVSKKWFARGAYVYSEKQIEQRPLRDAQTHAGEGDLYFFYRGLRSYFNLGYRYREEDAEADQYDYQSHAVKMRYVQRFKLFSKLAKLELGWTYEDRDYQGITPVISAERADKRQRVKLDLEVPVTERAALQFYLGYGDYQSNYSPADYTQNIAGTKVHDRW